MPSSNGAAGELAVFESEDSRLRGLVKLVKRAARSRDEISKDDLANAVTEFSQHSSIRGIPHDCLDTLIDVLTIHSNLSQSTTSIIVKSLYPRTKVSEEIAVKIVGCFGEARGKPSLTTQALLLRWLVIVYALLDGHTLLSQLYGVLFSMLDMITLRPHICYLLSKLTRRSHVKPFRIQALLELRQRVGKEQSLSRLLQVYKDYYPDVIVTDLGPTRPFSHPSPDWLRRVYEIQDANTSPAADPTISEQTSFQVAWKLGIKRRKTRHLTVPEVRTFKAVEASVTLEEIENAENFISRLEKLQLPNQLAAVLDDRLLQNLLSLRPSSASRSRIDNWLAAYLGEELPKPASNDFEIMLESIVNYTRHAKVLLPAIEKYLWLRLRMKLDTVSGGELELLAYLPPRTFPDLHSQFFSHLDTLLKGESSAEQAQLIDLYTALLRYWILVSKSPALQSALSTELEETYLTQYMRHIGTICTEILQASSQSVQVLDAALRFFETVVTIPLESTIWRLVLPPDVLVYQALFSGNAMTVSRICRILTSYKRAFQRSDFEHKNVAYPQSYLNQFNGFVIDACNLIWRNKGLIVGDKKVANLPTKVLESLEKVAENRDENIQTIFSLSHSFALSQITADSFKRLEEEARMELRHLGPITPKSLNALSSDGGLKISFMEYRVNMLDELEKKGLGGIKELMYNTMTSLMQGGQN